jgi:hypothetical protein
MLYIIKLKYTNIYKQKMVEIKIDDNLIIITKKSKIIYIKRENRWNLRNVYFVLVTLTFEINMIILFPFILELFHHQKCIKCTDDSKNCLLYL